MSLSFMLSHQLNVSEITVQMVSAFKGWGGLMHLNTSGYLQTKCSIIIMPKWHCFELKNNLNQLKIKWIVTSFLLHDIM